LTKVAKQGTEARKLSGCSPKNGSLFRCFFCKNIPRGENEHADLLAKSMV
jgi:hypothetical protein